MSVTHDCPSRSSSEGESQSDAKSMDSWEHGVEVDIIILRGAVQLM